MLTRLQPSQMAQAQHGLHWCDSCVDMRRVAWHPPLRMDVNNLPAATWARQAAGADGTCGHPVRLLAPAVL